MPELFYFNTDFDFSLAAPPELLARVQEVAHRKELLFWSLGDGQRHFICHSVPPNEQYTRQLAHYGLLPLKPALAQGTNYPGFQPVAWGWNPDAAAEFARFGLTAGGPAFSAVKAANSRQFAFDVARRHNLLLPHSRLVTSLDQLFATLQEWPLPLVVKPVFGNAGIGLNFIASRPLALKQEEELRQAFLQGGAAAVIEPWVKRVDDFSTYFQLTRDGRITDYTIQRCLVGRSGSFYGMVMEPGLKLQAGELLAGVAKIVATELQQIGYFGPVVIDGYTYLNEQEQLRINPLVEINARQTMGCIARHLLKRLDNVGAVLFRLARRKRCHNLDNFETVNNLLGKFHYQAGAARGITILTPLADALPRAQVLQNLFAAIGQDSKDCLDQLAMLEGLVLKTKETVEITQQFSLL